MNISDLFYTAVNMLETLAKLGEHKLESKLAFVWQNSTYIPINIGSQ